MSERRRGRVGKRDRATTRRGSPDDAPVIEAPSPDAGAPTPDDAVPGASLPNGEPRPSRVARRGRGRGALALAFVVLAAGAIAADRTSPASPPSPAAVRPAAPGGVLACPFLYAGNGRSWLHLANAGAVRSKVTVTTVRDNASPLAKTFTLEPGRATTMTIDPNVRQASSAIIEYAGGAVAASRTSIFNLGDERRGGTAAPCSRAGDRTLVVASGATLNADSLVVLLNPASSDALVDVRLLTDGEELAPEGLKDIIVPARGRYVIRTGDFAFDRKTVATVVNVRTGVVAADGLLASVRGITLIPASAPSADLAGVAAADGGQVLTDVVALGEANALTDASLMTPEGQSAYAALAQDLEPATPVTVSPGSDKTPALGVRLSLRDGTAIAGSLRWIVQLPSGKGDVAATLLGRPSRDLIAVTGDPATSLQSRVLLANPGDEPAEVSLSLLTGSGIVDPEVPSVTLEPGASKAVTIGKVSGSFAVRARSSIPVVMTISSTVLGRDVSAFSVAGLPASSGHAVAVESDPRLGVPARLRRAERG